MWNIVTRNDILPHRDLLYQDNIRASCSDVLSHVKRHDICPENFCRQQSPEGIEGFQGQSVRLGRRQARSVYIYLG